jgi:hypothetical protein
MTERWPILYEPGLRWIGGVERAIVRRDHPDQGAFVAIINAIEFQFDIGADLETVQHLLAALIRFATSRELPLDAIGLDADPAALLAKVAPKPRGSRTR